MTDSITTPLAAWLGIDWADEKHRWALRAATPAGLPATAMEQGEVVHSPEALEQFICALAARFPGQRIAIALEQSRGALLFVLSKYAHVVLYPIHPNTLDHYRKSFYPSGAKSDPGDAALILELLVKHPERLRQFEPDTVETRTLQFLVEHRRETVNEKTRCSNRLTAQLKMYFPQLLDWFEVDQVVLGQLLLAWPTLEQLRQARPSSVAQWFGQHHVREARVAELQQAIASSITATSDAAVIEVSVLTAQHLARQMALLRDSIALLDRRLAELTEAHPDQAIFTSLPGAGPVMVPRLIAALGTDRERFATASEMQCYSGIAPVSESSGKKKWVHWRWACPKFVRQTFHEWAWLSTRKSTWARAFYDQQRSKGKSHHATVRALAFKWQRVVFRCWKDRTPYDETRYQDSLAKRGKPVEIQMKNTGGLTSLKQLLS
jgi:transposase